LALPGLALWAVATGGLLHPLDAPAEGPGIPLPAAPGQVLGIVAPDVAAAAALLGWWREAAPEAVPPVIEAASGAAALPALAARAIAALAASAEEGMAAQQGLVALRQEHEALRLSQAALRRAAANIQPPAVPLLVASAEPSAGGHAVAAKDGRLALGQALGVKLEGLAAIALHLKEALAGAEAVLRVRLYGAESGRIAGAWVLPGRSLAAGWLTLDLLQAELTVALGDAAWLEAALWLQPEGTTIGAVADLSPAAPGARWSGWHPGVFGDGTCRLALSLPPDPPRRAVVALVLRNAATGPEDVLRVEIARLFGTRAAQPPPEAARRAPPPLRILPGVPAEAPVAAAVRLLERYLVPGGSYRHIDLLMEGVRAGEHAWPRLRCKLAVNGAVPSLEFRQRPDWPVLFETWPAGPSDAAGPYLQLTEAKLAGGFAATLAGDRARATLATILRLLPAVVATAARDATTDPEEYERWIASARQLAATLVVPATAGDPP
jgi:hypothetical protein